MTEMSPKNLPGCSIMDREVMMKKILLVEDDSSLVKGLLFALEKQGYGVDSARSGAEALELWQPGKYDLVILDVSLPDGSGFDICRSIRLQSGVPILFLTAADEETDIIMGLDIGGDDYITKPFKLAILLSRINALLRRSGHFENEPVTLRSGDIRMDLLNGTVYRGDERIELTSGEYKLLRLFLENPDRVFSPDQLLAHLWECDGNFAERNTITVYIRRLRLKIEEDPADPVRIVTVRGFGYKWNSGD